MLNIVIYWQLRFLARWKRKWLSSPLIPCGGGVQVQVTPQSNLFTAVHHRVNILQQRWRLSASNGASSKSKKPFSLSGGNVRRTSQPPDALSPLPEELRDLRLQQSLQGAQWVLTGPDCRTLLVVGSDGRVIGHFDSPPSSPLHAMWLTKSRYESLTGGRLARGTRGRPIIWFHYATIVRFTGRFHQMWEH